VVFQNLGHAHSIAEANLADSGKDSVLPALPFGASIFTCCMWQFKGSMFNIII
jgi:hypothetical protein